MSGRQNDELQKILFLQIHSHFINRRSLLHPYQLYYGFLHPQPSRLLCFLNPWHYPVLRTALSITYSFLLHEKMSFKFKAYSSWSVLRWTQSDKFLKSYLLWSVSTLKIVPRYCNFCHIQTKSFSWNHLL